MAELSPRPVWSMLEADGSGGRDDAGHWVAVYTNLLTLLGNGAAVSIGDRHGRELVGLALDDVRQRLDFWQSRLNEAS